MMTTWSAHQEHVAVERAPSEDRAAISSFRSKSYFRTLPCGRTRSRGHRLRNLGIEGKAGKHFWNIPGSIDPLVRVIPLV
jgi:hypothetical protein